MCRGPPRRALSEAASAALSPRVEVKQGPPSEMSYVWREGFDQNYQRTYYFNADTGESRWVAPDEPYRPYDPLASSSSEDDESGE